MKLFNRETVAIPTEKTSVPPTTPKVPAMEGWGERELIAVYSAAHVRRLHPRESLFSDADRVPSFFMVLEGELSISVKWGNHTGRPGAFRKGDCVAPLLQSPGLLYSAQAAESCTVIEITPNVFNLLPEKAQLAVYKVATAATSRINAYIRAVNGEVSGKNALLASYIGREHARRAASVQSDFVQGFFRDMPRMPAYAMDLAAKLLDDNASVQEIVEGIKSDPAVASIVLRSVNSAQFSFQKKIETFYHASMILGLNNLYNLILREAVQSAMPNTPATQRIHEHSCLLSVLCYEIAFAAKDLQAQNAMTIGLLHDIGRGVAVLMKDAHPERADWIDTMPTARLGSELLRLWGIPERICEIIERQQEAEFMAPDVVSSTHMRELGVLHIAHVLEAMMRQETLEPEVTIYTRDYMTAVGLPFDTPAELLNERIRPNLTKSRHRLPKQIRAIVGV